MQQSGAPGIEMKAWNNKPRLLPGLLAPRLVPAGTQHSGPSGGYLFLCLGRLHEKMGCGGTTATGCTTRPASPEHENQSRDPRRGVTQTPLMVRSTHPGVPLINLEPAMSTRPRFIAQYKMWNNPLTGCPELGRRTNSPRARAR